MIESPLIQEIVEEAMAKGEIKARQHDILEILQTRFPLVSPELISKLQSTPDLKKLDDLLRHALQCTDLQAFKSLLEK